MHSNFLPVLVVLSLGVMPALFAQPDSVLQLEQSKHGKPPFRTGDQLDVQSDATASLGMTRITVLDTTHWPWVLVKSEPGETWLNFDHLVIARSVAIAK